MLQHYKTLAIVGYLLAKSYFLSVIMCVFKILTDMFPSQESRIYAVAKSGIRLSETSCTDPASKGETEKTEATHQQP